jgi:hypothetical protein
VNRDWTAMVGAPAPILDVLAAVENGPRERLKHGQTFDFHFSS